MLARRLRNLFFVLSALILALAACQDETLASAPEPPTSSNALPLASPASQQAADAATYYIRPDGGSAAQCSGLADTPYPGSGSGLDCAWNHPFQALPPGGAARISGGSTLIIAAGSYAMGYGAPGAEACDFGGSFDCHMPPIPSGLSSASPTRILGAGWDAGCGSPPELWGTGRPWFVLNLTGASYVNITCLEITDHSSCIEDHVFPTSGSQYTCERVNPPYGDWAAAGMYAADSTGVNLRDLNIHGLANTGVLAGRLKDWTVENVRIVGNGQAGWNGDIDGNDANTGTMTFRRWVVEWNGCGETYPDERHPGCWGQEAGGYGDGVGTGETGGHWIIEDSSFRYNSSDGLDLLYARLPGAQIEIRRTVAANNDGNQIKTTGNVSIENTLIVSHCSFFHDMPYWNNADDCRAGGDALAFALNPGGMATVVNTTITGAGVCLVIAECALDQTCNGNETVTMRNVLFQGQPSFFNPEEDACFAWYDDESGSPLPANPFVVESSLITGVRFGNVTPCPGPGNLCAVPAGVVNPAIDAFDARLLSGSAAIDAGSSSGAPPVDLDGFPRDSTPDIGAYEWRTVSAWLYLPVAVR